MENETYDLVPFDEIFGVVNVFLLNLFTIILYRIFPLELN